MAAKTGVYEKQIGELFNRFIYAAFKDISRDWNGVEEFSPALWQNYDNLIKAKDDKSDGLKNRFTIAIDVKQFLSFLFNKLIEEVRNIKMVEGDTVTSITRNLVEANAECFSAYMFAQGAKYKDSFGETLKSASDPTRYFHNQITGALPMYVGAPILIGIISTEFERYLKAKAFIVAKLIWYYKASVSGELFLGLTATTGMSQVMLDLIQCSLRDKPPAKPRAKKAAGAADAPAATPATAPAGVTAPATAAVTAPATATATAPATAPNEAIPAAAPVENDALADVLANV